MFGFEISAEILKQISTVIAGIFTLLSVLIDIKDKNTNKVTRLGGLVLSISALSIGVAFFAQNAENKENEQRAQKTQESMVELLQNMRTSVSNLTRILQPLEAPKVTLFFDLECPEPKYNSFCESAQKQSDAEFAEHNKMTALLPEDSIGRVLPEGSSFSGGKKFDWSKWPGFPLGPFTLLYLHVFKNETDLNSYLEGECLRCAEIGDMTFDSLITGENLSAHYLVQPKRIWVSYLASLAMKPSIITGSIVSSPDMDGSFIAASDENLFEALQLTTIFIDTPRGQRITGKFEKRQIKNRVIYVAKLSLSRK